MTAPLTEAEQAYHRTVPVPPQSRQWRVREDNHFWVACCDTESAIRYPSAAEATDAAIYHLRHCPEARRHG